MIESAAWIAAFMAGLLGSGHCFGMCGGIAGSLGALSGSRNQAPARLLGTAIQFNLGRVLSYVLLGAITAGVLGGIGDLMAWKGAGRVLRFITALMVFLIGLRFLVDWRGLEFIERGGARLWAKITPLVTRASRRSDGLGRLALGMCWGLLPCGLVYSILVTAASTGSAVEGGITMLAFAMGTLPAMTGMTAAAPTVAAFLGDRMVRRLVGFSLVLLAAWMAIPILSAWLGQAPVHHH